jgi:hypothetical protein
MTIYITKYWESSGILEREVDEFVDGGGDPEKYVKTKAPDGHHSLFLRMGADAFKTMDEALEKVEKAALAKVKKTEQKVKFYRAVALDGRKCMKK